jgi:hypothetical protein
MRPFEADCFVAGWDACVAGKPRSDNPYKRPFGSAWDSYRRDAWDRGWFHCERGERWNDPRKKAVAS